MAVVSIPADWIGACKDYKSSAEAASRPTAALTAALMFCLQFV
jgi:hypothetical protein